MVDWKKLISQINAGTIEKKIKIAADVVGCSPRTMRRLYDGARPKNIGVYEQSSKMLIMKLLK